MAETVFMGLPKRLVGVTIDGRDIEVVEGSTILDTCRLDPAKGQERPGSGPMGEKLDAMLKEPPPGVQVWSACVEKQQSYETDNAPMGVFLDELESTLRKGLRNKIQHPPDPLPLEAFQFAARQTVLCSGRHHRQPLRAIPHSALDRHVVAVDRARLVMHQVERVALLRRRRQ